MNTPSYANWLSLCLLGLATSAAQAAGGETARLQVIHNAADPAASIVDVYFGNDLALDDFAFRDATPYLTVPAGVEIPVGVAPGTSTGVQDVIATIPVQFEAGKTYVAIANGVLDDSMFEMNPDGRPIGFTLFATDSARESAKDGSMVDFLGVHGATDAPSVDIVARGVGTLLDDVSYGDISGYLSVPPAEYLLDVTPGNDNGLVVATFAADLSGLAGGAAVVFASGFLSPENDQDGAAFGLFAALPDGTVAEFPLVTTARVQVIHNAADPAASSVDVYLGDALALDDFAFRAATPFLDLPANQTIAIGVAPGNSNDVGDVLASFDVNLLAAETYVVVANGVLDPGSFAPNPEGRDTGFQLLVKPMARESASDSKSVDILALHGATDAPAVQVRALPGGLLVPEAAYGDFSEYLNVPADRYTLYLRRADLQPGFLKGYLADLSGLSGEAITVFASGFLSPMANQDGPRFGLFAATASGAVVELPNRDPFVTIRSFDPAGRGKGSVGVANAWDPFAGATGLALAQNSPNPARGTTEIAFQIPTSGPVQIKVYDPRGREISTLVDEEMSAGVHSVTYDADLPSGVYYYELRTQDGREVRTMNVLR
ncbi:MAG: DUF4397 domain-containing protein [Candidatus Eisenbacteria bacterium]